MKLSGIKGPDRRSPERHAWLWAALALCGFTAFGCSKSEPLQLDVEVNYCATIESFSVAPIAQPIGRSIRLSAVLEDAEGDFVYPRWSSLPEGNTIDDSTAHDTRFNCLEEGRFTIFLEATDGICGEVDHTEVECFSVVETRRDAGVDDVPDEPGTDVDAGSPDAGGASADAGEGEHPEFP